jgi:hypothetical protein
MLAEFVGDELLDAAVYAGGGLSIMQGGVTSSGRSSLLSMTVMSLTSLLERAAARSGSAAPSLVCRAAVRAQLLRHIVPAGLLAQLEAVAAEVARS